MSDKGTVQSCKCKWCQSACTYKPGRFAPGEAEKAAKFLSLSLKEFFKKYLLVDYWIGGDIDKSVFLLSPAVQKATTGEMFPFNPKGQCVFFKDGLCQIHSVRPLECRLAFHDLSRDTLQANARRVIKLWRSKKHQEQIKQLLGRTPEVPEVSNADFFSLLLSGIHR